MSSRSDAQATAFQKAIEAAEHLNLRKGLSAIKKSEGKNRVTAKDSRNVLGSVAIDADCNVPPYMNSPRWDYAVGYRRNTDSVVHYIEVHSADTTGVSDVEKKLRWLRDFLERDAQEALSKLKSEFHWVASSRVRIPKNTPQYRKLTVTLRKQGLLGPVEHLQLA